MNTILEAFIYCTRVLAYPAFYGPAGLAVLTGIFIYSWQTDKTEIH